MKRILESLSLLLGMRQDRLYFPQEKQVCVFNKRPILYRDFSPKSVQESINELQELLKAKGLEIEITGKFDLQTDAAVKEFQQGNHFVSDGVVGPLTWACLLYPKLYRGQKKNLAELRDAVEELQNILYKEEFLKKQPNGYFDWETERAVKRFQRVYGLKTDGIVGAATWAVLLGMRQKIDKSFPQLVYFLSPQSWFVWQQFLMICFILLGIYYSPIPGEAPQMNTALATAYGLTCIVPFLIECLPLKQPQPKKFPLLEYAPYVLTGFFWKPIVNFLGMLFN
ncbi:peptidoglycan-binding protein [Nostoc sp. LEGE 06077]|uniref:peptidoglycan-binding domain-containing protein n=1 Tax=Nostoc sp. LEGE 06077 TaxID=915325 RepID=UPI0018808505|nr:peptidoglycan-binding protein [Nostoc sp. LEGE 06077]MBE9205257.1 peptidoglycan-binding protein [Nostoc sp. LEGE 06077]